MSIQKKCIAVILGSVIFSNLQAQPVSPPDDSPDRKDAVEPFRMIGNIHYVGATRHLVSYLITTPAGHIIIDTGYEETAPKILENIKKLGHNPADIKLILTHHAHRDHVGGHALIQEETGGQILAPEGDAEIIRTGGKTDDHTSPWTPAKVDRIFKDGEQISLGGTVLTAHLTPGHTKGCTTWTMEVEEAGQKYDVVFLCGVRIEGDSLLSDRDYPDVASDLAGSFKTLKGLPVDVYLGGHGYWYDLGGKVERMKKGEGYKAFIDPEGYRAAIDGWQQQFIDRLVKEAMAKKYAGAINGQAVPGHSQTVSPAADRWGQAAPLLEAVGEQAVAQLDGKIYLIGGKLEGKGYVATVQVYDMATDTWEWGTPLAVPVDHNVAAVVNGKIYNIGGQTQTAKSGGSPTDSVFEYNPSTQQWRVRAPLPIARTASAIAVVNDKIYVVGGRTPPRGNDVAVYDDFAVYDPATDTWTRLPDLPTRRHHLNAVAIGGKIYVAGGTLIVGGGEYGSGGGITNVLEIFDPATNTWSQGQPMPTAREGATGVTANGCFHVFGGEGDHDAPAGLMAHEFYNPVTDTWTKRPDIMPIPVNGVSRGVYQNGKVYLPGGTTTPGDMQINVLQTYRTGHRCQ